MNVRLFKPSVGAEELEKIKEAFERSWLGMGPALQEFEKKWADFVGCKVAYGLNSATAALHLALKTFDFPEGKKVLVPSLTFSASATAVLYNRLTPVFVDSDPVTLGMSMDDLEKKYDEDCVAIVAVHYAGHPLPMDRITAFARQKNLRVVEDCAHTAGSLYKGKMLGNWGDISCFSFEEKKLITTGDGGMICSDDPELLKDIKALRWVGIDKDNWKTAKKYTDTQNLDAMHWFYEISLPGYKYNMNDLAASIGLAQLEKLPRMNRRRSEIIRMYMDGIQGLSSVKPLLPYEPEKYNYWMFGVRAEKRDELIIHLKSLGVATGCHYTPLTLQPLFQPYAGDCSYVEKEADKLITLPLHADLTDEEVAYVLEGINSFAREKAVIA
jgi:perosamine synthetase